MAKENRFSGLIDGLGKSETDSKPTEKPESKAESKPTKKQSKKAKYEDKTNYKQVGLYLPVEIHKKLKIGSAITGKEMSEIAAEGIELWLKENTPNI
ncbi:MAG: hypothetical protein AAFP09_00925 [Cyanobacteria bacterium J06607_10]